MIQWIQGIQFTFECYFWIVKIFIVFIFHSLILIDQSFSNSNHSNDSSDSFIWFVSFNFILFHFDLNSLNWNRFNWTIQRLNSRLTNEFNFWFTQHNNKVKVIWLIHSSLTFQLIHWNILTLKQVNFTSQLYFVFFILLFKQFSSFFHFVAFIHSLIHQFLTWIFMNQTNESIECNIISYAKSEC